MAFLYIELVPTSKSCLLASTRRGIPAKASLSIIFSVIIETI